MGFAEQFFSEVARARTPTEAFVSRMNFFEAAKPWLLALYQVIRATTPVLEYAARASEGAMRKFYETKLREERGHDLMLMGDLRHAGILPSEAIGAPPNPFIAEMVGRQYYLVDFVHASAYLGFIGLLEGFPPTAAQVDELARISGLPSATFRTARMHANVDVKHREELAKVLDAVPKAQQFAILDNGIRCAELQRAALVYLSKESPHVRPEQHSSGTSPGADAAAEQWPGRDGAGGGHL